MPGVDPALLRATSGGTATYVERFAARFTPGFFRPTSFGLMVSSIGIGTYLGNNTDDDDTAYESALRHAIESGINLIDTAINYRSQRSEMAVGAAIQDVITSGKANRQEIVVCTKGGYIPLDRTPPATRSEYREYVKREFFDQEILRPDEVVGGGHSLAPRFLRYCLAKSRQNLGVRTIDVYYVHNPSQQLGVVDYAELLRRLRGAFTVLEEAVSRGEIGVYGCATWDGLRQPPGAKEHVNLGDLVALAREIAGDSHHFRVVQAPINLAMLEAATEPTQALGGKLVTLIEAADELGIDVVASASLMQSRLLGTLPAAVREHFPQCTTDAQRALAFSRAVPGVTAALVGMKTRHHIEENLGAAPPG
jgi:aryl-alcohol dehydrogenase-like predicted oxidoreductase